MFVNKNNKKVYTSEDLHLCTFKSPTLSADSRREEQVVAYCAFTMRNGVKWLSKAEPRRGPTTVGSTSYSEADEIFTGIKCLVILSSFGRRECIVAPKVPPILILKWCNL